MMTNPLVVVIVTILLIILSAFFVIIEFSLLGARRHRLEEMAVNNRGARAALKAVNELTVMLAGAQLGITVVTFALGAVTKPAVDTLLSSIFVDIGIPGWIAGGTSFFLSLLFVTFIHLVVGEMAPKSWAIAHPEGSASFIALPARAFIWIFRPLLTWINHMANKLVKASGVEPVESAAVGGQDIATIRQLIHHSTNVGALEESMSTPISSALNLESLQVKDLVDKNRIPTKVDKDATLKDVQEATERTGHKRILILNDDQPSIIHVRDTLLEDETRPVRELSRPAFVLESETLVHEALRKMRGSSEQLAVVMKDDEFIGVVTINDILNNALPD